MCVDNDDDDDDDDDGDGDDGDDGEDDNVCVDNEGTPKAVAELMRRFACRPPLTSTLPTTYEHCSLLLLTSTLPTAQCPLYI